MRKEAEMIKGIGAPPAETQKTAAEVWMIWPLVFVFWTLIGAIAAVQEYIAIETRGAPVSLVKTIITNLPIYFWALSTPLIFRIEQKFPLGERRKWGLVFPVHIALSLLFAALYLGLVALVAEAMRDAVLSFASIWGYFKYRFGRAFHVSVLTYWAILGFGFALSFSQRLKKREIEAARTEQELETRLVQSKLDNLKMQLHPHFLFNTLNTISAIMSDDIRGARRVIARLSELLRINLESSHRQTITLREELDLLDLYLDIERERFREKLEVNISVPPELWEFKVPHFILQPLVENAIKHGIAGNQKKGLIEIRAARREDFLIIEIGDNGTGFSKTSEQGIGLSNTRERLDKLYGINYEFTLKDTKAGGTRVFLRIPVISGQKPVISGQ